MHRIVCLGGTARRSASVEVLTDGGRCTTARKVAFEKAYRTAPVNRRYDTIRDASLTCARKPTRLSLIYRTETTTKIFKTGKLKSKNGYARSNSKSLGNHVVSPEEEKVRLQWEGCAENGGFKSGMKDRVGGG